LGRKLKKTFGAGIIHIRIIHIRIIESVERV